MEEVKVGQLWELYSAERKDWVRAAVRRVEREQVTFQYEDGEGMHLTTRYRVECFPGLYRLKARAGLH